MLTVRCAKCGTPLKLQRAPASGQVKCPKCGNIVPVRAAAAVGAGGRSLDPDDDGFDFAAIQFPSASPTPPVSHFPLQGNLKPYDGPIPGDPLMLVAEPSNEHSPGTPAPNASPAKQSISPKALIAIVGSVAALLIAVIVGAVMLGGDTSASATSNVDVVAEAQKTAPSGYSAVGIYGCVVLMPEGVELDEVPSAIESRAVMSNASESVYYLGAMDGGKREIDHQQMRKKASRMLGGDILGGTPMERNGYQGIKGMLDGSLFLPRMQVEIFHIDERFVIIGCAPASMGADPSVKIDRQLEAAEQEIFYDSFKIGPKPGGSWLF